MHSLKGLTVLHTESSLGWGGQEIRIIEESLGMRKRGYRMLIAAPVQSVINMRARENSLETFDIEFSRRNPLSLLKIRSLIDSEMVDILNTHSSKDSWAAGIAASISKSRPKIIRTRHLSTPISTSALSRFVYNTLTDAILTTGEEIRQTMINVNGFTSGKITSVPTGIDIDAFDPDGVEPSLESKGFAVGMISVLRSWKGHEYFVRAVPQILEKIPEASFYIAGGGPQLGNIKALIEKLSLNNKILMLGHREDVPRIFKSLDVVVHPSYANEGVPQSILQAMAMRKPVVASDAGAIKEVVADGRTGFLIKPKDPSMIADKVIALYKNPSLRNAFGEAGRKMVENGHSIGAMLDKIEGIYAEIMKAR